MTFKGFGRWEGEQRIAGGARAFLAIATGSLFTCLQGSQPSEWASLALLLDLVSEDPVLWNSAPVGPPLTLLGMGLLSHSMVRAFPGTLQLARTAIGEAVLSGVYCCCINLHLKLTIKCF